MTPPSRAIAPLDFLQLLAIALIWGANNVAAKVAVDAFPAMMTAALRFGVVLVLLAPWLRWPAGGNWKLFVAMLACAGPLHFGVLYTGLRMAEHVTPMVVAMQLWAPASVIVAAIWLGERVDLLRWGGVALAFAGAVSLTFDPTVFSQAGALAVTGCASVIYGAGAAMMRRVAPMKALSMQAWVAAATAPAMAVGSAIGERGQVEAVQTASWVVWAAILFGALVSSVLASTMLFRLVQKYEVSRTTPYLLLSPAFSFVLAGLLLGDDITFQIVLGAAITMGGVALVALSERRLKATA